MDVQQVPPSTIEQYANGTVTQVQAIQSLQVGQSERVRIRARELET
jgi:hypothetical protein